MIQKKHAAKMITAATVAGLALTAIAPVFADTSTTAAVTAQTGSGTSALHGGMGMKGRGMNMKNGVMGKVTAINGTTLTVTSQAFRGFDKKDTTTGTATTAAVPASIVYTVDASKATVTKDKAASTVSAIAINDTVMVQGTVTGTNVVATTIRDEVMPVRPAPIEIKGNGQPVVAGTVSAISGTTLTVTNNGSVTYTVTTSGATIVKPGNTTATVANISVGDQVVVQGTVNGSTIAATSVIDQAKKPASSTTGTTTGEKGGHGGGFFGGIGNFFKGLFGF